MLQAVFFPEFGAVLERVRIGFQRVSKVVFCLYGAGQLWQAWILVGVSL